MSHNIGTQHTSTMAAASPWTHCWTRSWSPAVACFAGKAQQLEEQLRNAQQDKDDVALQLRVLQEEALELRKAKEAAVIEKEQLTTRLESESHQLQVEWLAEGDRNRNVARDLPLAPTVQIPSNLGPC